MPYDDFYDINNISNVSFDDSNDNFSDNVEKGFENFTGEDQTEYDGFSDIESDECDSVDDNELDYSVYLEDIISNQETIILNQETIIALDTEIKNNGHRLYYFVGGLYVAFAIVVMVKFFKTFLF